MAFWRTKARMDSLTSLHTRAALEEELFFPSSAPPDAAANLRDYVVGLGSFQKNQRHLWTLGGRPRVSYTRANNPFQHSRLRYSGTVRWRRIFGCFSELRKPNSRTDRREDPTRSLESRAPLHATGLLQRRHCFKHRKTDPERIDRPGGPALIQGKKHRPKSNYSLKTTYFCVSTDCAEIGFFRTARFQWSGRRTIPSPLLF